MKTSILSLQYIVSFLKKSSILPYLGIVIVLASTFRIHPSGDTQALLTGLTHALSCLSDSPMRLPCGAEVVHFPIFQYLIATPLALIGLANASMMTIFGLMSVAWSLIACVAFWRAGFLSTAARGGHFGVLILLSGYSLWYMTSSFNEATSFTLFALLALSVIDRWRIAYVCVIAFACTITKEVAFPFVLYFMFLSFLAREIRADQPANLIGRFFQFFDHYKFTIASVIAGIALNLAFNYFRFGSYRNLGLIAPELFTPWECIPSFLSYLFVSPAGGLFFTWLSLCVLLIVPLLFFVRDRSAFFIVGFTLLGLVGANFGLSMWYSPFGWYAWGPRLTLPFLGAIGILGVYLVVPHILNYVHGAKNRNSRLILIFLVIAASSFPNIAIRIDEGAFFSKMFAPTKVAIDSGIKSFTVQTAPTRLYMEATSETLARNIVIPTTIEVTLRHWPIILLWLLSLFYICRQLIVPGGSSSGDIIDAPDSGGLYSGPRAVKVGRTSSTGPSWTLFATLNVLFFLIGGALFANSFTCQTCLDLMSKVGWGGATAAYRLIGPQESLVKGLDNFPARLSLAEIQVELSVDENLVGVGILAPDGLGQWTSQPINHLWGIGIIDKEGGYKIRNEGPRRKKLNLPISHTLTLWIPDNGNLSKCRDLDIELLFEGGKRISTSAGCKGGGNSAQTVTAPQVTKTKIGYQLISPQERLVKNLDNFPATQSLAEIHVEMKEVGNLASIGVFAPDGLGQWTSRPISHLWGIGIIDKEGGFKIRNEGPRKENLNLPIIRTLTLWVPDNGNLSKCVELTVILSLVDGTTHNYVAQCK